MNRWSLILAIVAATGAAFSVVIHGELRDERARSALLQAELDQLREVRASDAAEPAVDFGAETVAAGPQADTAMPTAHGSQQDDGGRRQRWLETERVRLADPEYRAAWIAQQRQMIERRYPQLAADLKLSPEQADRLLELLATQMLEGQQLSMEVQARLVSPDGSPTADMVRERERLTAARQQEFEQTREALLGADKYKEWRDYQNSREARAQMRELRGRLASGGSPLGDGQFDQLVSMITAEQQRYQEELQRAQTTFEDAGGPQSGDRVTYLERRMELVEQTQQRTLESVAAYMDAAQLEAYRQMQKAELQREKAQLRMWRARRNTDMQGSGG
ncbi:MAG: hypothetical protein ACT4UP_09415 [Gammaproteobacteria bacterium]